VSRTAQPDKGQVRFTEEAISDLRGLARKDPQIVRACFKKFLVLERNPHAGEPLLGGLVGFRKLTVGDRTWRIVWRVGTDVAGQNVVEVAEVWAVGAREDAQVYAEVSSRVAALGDDPITQPLAQVLQALSKVRALRLDVAAAQHDAEDADSVMTESAREPIPIWLAGRLTQQAGYTQDELARLSPEEAMDAWDAWMSRRRS
jgi:mRNA interferase RelE/StbE